MGITLPANLSVYISIALFVLGAYLFALYVGLIVWTYRDIRARSRDGLAHILAVLLVATLTVAGLFIYLLLRPHTTLAEEFERSLAEETMLKELEEQRACPHCNRRTQADFIVCPYCRHELRRACAQCGRLLNLNWRVCPYCGAENKARTPVTIAKPSAEVAPEPMAEEVAAAPAPEIAPAETGTDEAAR